MPEVNLKDYFNRLNNLLGENAADEVIHHCRHILRYYPKNVDTYRFLGQALVLIGRWEEAQAALRRVLSVLPNDYTAHVMLGEVFDHTNRCDDAIWHLERALDQRPNDKALLDALRVLYQRCRQTGQLKIQMTAGSVAQQHHRSGSDEYAIETLRGALKQSPDRVDLRLMMAEILWDMGREDEAADNAIDVLKVLPDCLAANRILAQLWLSVDRPSDAQQYVNRIESVDPYLAVELVQGTPPDDDAFGVDELDFKRSAQSEMVSARPNWLTDLGISASNDAATDESDEPGDAWSSGMLSTVPKTTPAPSDSVEESDLEWLGAVPMIGDSDSDAFRPMTGDLLSTDELENLFGNSESAPAAPVSYTPQPAVPEEASPFAWMQASGIEMTDEPVLEEPGFPSFFDESEESDAPILDQNINPLAWMESYGGSDLVIDEPAPAADDPPPYYASSGDSPQSSTYDQPPYPYAAEPQNTLEELDWMRSGADDDSLFASDSAPPYETASDEPAAPPSSLRGLTSILNEANLDWLQQPGQEAESGSEEELDDWLNQFEPASPRTPVSDSPDWLSSLDDSPPSETPAYDAAAPTGFGSGVVEDAFDTNVEELAWMSESERPEKNDEPEKSDVPDWLSEFEPNDETPTPAGAAVEPEADDAFSWSNLSTYEEQPDEQGDPLGSVPDWLREAAPLSQEAVSDTEATMGGTDFDWLTDDALAGAETEAASAAGSVLEPGDDWLTQFSPEADTLSESSALMESSGDAVAEANDLDWLNELSGESAQSGASAEPVTDAVGEEFTADLETIPDWLSDLQPENAELPVASASIEAPSVDETPDWLSGLQPETAEPPVSSASSEAPTLDETPDWLADLQPETGESLTASASIEAPTLDETPDWLAGLQPESVSPMASDDAEDMVSEAVPDWLTEVQPEETVAAVAANELSDEDETFDWLDAMPAVELPETSLSDEVEASLDASFGATPEVTPLEEEAVLNDWLAGLAPIAETPEAAKEIEAEGLVLDNIELEPIESEQVSVVGEFAADTGEEDANDDAWEMPSPTFENGEDTLIFRPDAPDISEDLEDIITEEDFEESFPDVAPAVALDSLDNRSDDELEEEAVSDMTADDLAAGNEEFEPFHEEEPVPTPADNAPDWLNAMVPGLDVDYEAQENVLPEEEFEPVLAAAHPEPETASDFGWLERIVEDELEADTAALAAAGPRFVFSRQPAWMRQAAQQDDDLPDWPVDSDDDTPDWLR